MCYQKQQLMRNHLKDITGPLLDPVQFSYWANRAVHDAVNMELHFVLQHLDSTGTYARILFVDFSSPFNTIILGILKDKLSLLTPPASTCQWIYNSLIDRRQERADEAGKHLLQHPYHQHWRPPGVCCFPAALLPLHQQMTRL